jgi:hypothetical protein
VSQCLDPASGNSIPCAGTTGTGAGGGIDLSSAIGALVTWAGGAAQGVLNVFGGIGSGLASAISQGLSGVAQAFDSPGQGGDLFPENPSGGINGSGWNAQGGPAVAGGTALAAAAISPSMLGRLFQSGFGNEFGLAENLIEDAGYKLLTSLGNTVPDFFAEGAAMAEVKYVQYLTMSSQIEAQLEFALSEGMELYFIVGTETEVAGTIFNAAAATGGRVVAWDAVTGVLSDAATGVAVSADEAWAIVSAFAARSITLVPIINPQLIMRAMAPPQML